MSLPADVDAYRNALKEKLQDFKDLASSYGPPVTTQVEAFAFALEDVVSRYILLAQSHSIPATNVQQAFYAPLAAKVAEITELAEENRGHADFNKLMALKSACEVLLWVQVAPKPAVFIKECSDQSAFYANRVRKDGSDNDKAWVKALLQALTSLQTYVQDYYPTGLLWKGSNKVDGESAVRELSAMLANCDLSGAPAPSARAGQSAAASGDGSSEISEAYLRDVGPQLEAFRTSCSQIGGIVQEQGEEFYNCAKNISISFLEKSDNYSAPLEADYPVVFKPVVESVTKITSFCDRKDALAQLNYLNTVKSASEGLTWIYQKGRPHDFIKECSDQAQFYGNRVLKDGGDAGKEWVRSLLKFFNALQAYAKEYHSSGLVWKGKEKLLGASAGGAPPPPPPGSDEK